MFDLIIIGGGVVGCAAAREASKYNLKTALFEREADVAEGISKANSGVLHAGFNVRPGSLKARFNVEGLALCPALAEELDVDYRICGKMVVGTSDSDLPYLNRLLDQGKANGCSGLSIIGTERIRELEPGVSGKWALLSESTGIISPFKLTVALAENAAENGVEFTLNAEVISVRPLPGGGFSVRTADGECAECRWLINAAGMGAADMKSLVEEHDSSVYPCRGEYYITDKTYGSLLNMAVYPVPPTDGSGLGVHLTPTCNGNILIGPSADYIDDGEDTANTAPVMRQLKKEAGELFPALADASYIKNYSGIRPKLFNGGSGENFADFEIAESKKYPGMINLIGIESPGLTSAPAIAAHLFNEIIGGREKLTPNPEFNPQRMGIIRTSKLEEQQLAGLVEEEPDYAEIICRCEQISRAEIIQAVRNPLGAVSLAAVKKRTYAMMGRCQSGFCLPKVIDIISRETGLSPEKIIKTGAGSEVLMEELKQ